jgi:hypothetical protein
LNAGRKILLAAVLSVSTFIGVAVGQEARYAAGASSPAASPAKVVDGVGAQLRLLRVTPSGWELELTVRNDGKRAVYMMTDPVRSEGSKGPYLSVDPLNPSVLDLSVRVYPLLEYCIYVNHAVVTLEKLEPGGSRVQRFTLPPPDEETTPPYPAEPITPRRISPADIKYVMAHVGVLPDEEGVRDYLRSKEGIGPYAKGPERLDAGSFKGKQIIDLQTLVASEKVELKP